LGVIAIFVPTSQHCTTDSETQVRQNLIVLTN
jgi:hypothetical protein